MKLLSDRFQAMAAKLEEKKKLLGVEDDADGKGGSEIVRRSLSCTADKPADALKRFAG